MDDIALFLGRLHPALVHVPIGLIAGVVLLESRVLLSRSATTQPGIHLLLICTAAAAAASAGAGLLLSDEGGYNSATIERHRFLGLTTTAALVVSVAAHGLWLRRSNTRLRALYRISLLVALVAVVPAGHLGGSLTHGADYLVDAAPSWLRARWEAGASSTNRSEAELRSVYSGTIQPLLDERCYSCHGPEKQKGELRLDLAPAALAGGKSGVAAVVPGEATQSELVRRILLGEDHDDAMPRRGERFSPAEVMSIVQWINEGAVFSTLPAADAEAIAMLRERGALAEPIAKRRAEVRASLCEKNPKVGAADLDALGRIAPQLVWLSLAGCEVKDEELAGLAAFTELKHLHLERTDLGNAALAPLSGLTNLESLNLYGTNVTDQGLVHLERLEKLNRLYVWQTGVTVTGAQALSVQLPELEIVLGWTSTGEYEVVGGPKSSR